MNNILQFLHLDVSRNLEWLSAGIPSDSQTLEPFTACDIALLNTNRIYQNFRQLSACLHFSANGIPSLSSVHPPRPELLELSHLSKD